MSARDFKRQMILHVMATYSRIRGLFVGVLRPGEKNISELSLSLLSTILLNSANTLESFEFHRVVQKAHEDLEERVKERTLKLAEANEKLQVEIAERKRAEAALRQTGSLLQNTFKAIPDLLTVHDRDLRVVLSNRHGQKEVIEGGQGGLPYCYGWYMHRDKPCEPCPTLEVFRTGRAVKAEVANPHSHRILEVSAYPVFDGWGKVELVTEHVRDITERKRTEEEQLKISKLESTGILAGGIAHDFNNLLTAILGNIELAKMASSPEGQIGSYLMNAEKAGTVARGLTSQLITFADGGAPVTEVISIVDLVKEAAAFALSGSSVQGELFLPDDLWFVKADHRQMRQVVQNMILNAREALPEGGTVLVRAKNVTVHLQEGLPLPEGHYLKVSIEDRGCGIPEQIVSKIFDPYFSTKQRGNQKGMGLGLTICHSIVKNHGGYIQVESQVNRGTTCHVYLPAFKDEATLVPHEDKGSSGTKGRVLVMDDEEMVRDYIGMALGQMGYETAYSKNGEEAIALYKKAMDSRRPFSTVILDLTVRGGMGGKETMKRLLEIDPKVEAVISSGYSNDPIMLEYREHGFKGALAKPFQISQLVEIVSTVEISP